MIHTILKYLKQNNLPEISKELKRQYVAILCNALKDREINRLFLRLYNYDYQTAIHSIRVSLLSFHLGCKLGFNNEMLKDIVIAGLLHDTGKLFISRAIINKPDALTEEEYSSIKTHIYLLNENKEIRHLKKNIVDGMVNHHENVNGTGYRRLKNLGPIEKILRITDSFDAMTGGRIYEKGISSEEAISRLFEYENIWYDKMYVNKFSELYQKSENQQLRPQED